MKRVKRFLPIITLLASLILIPNLSHAKCLKTQDAYQNPILKRFPLKTSQGSLEIPTYSNHDYNCRLPQISNVIVMIHGSGRNAKTYYQRSVLAGKSSGNHLNRTLIVAPKFFIPTDKDQNSKSIYWKRNAYWKIGHNSDPSLKFRMSSFEIVDRIIAHLNQKEILPNLKSIKIAGHSAGGQFVNRYAAGNLLKEKNLVRSEVSLSYVVANPSSYLYFNDKRCLNFKNLKCQNFNQPVFYKCPKYDQYKHGINNLNSYMKRTGAENLISNYPLRRVHYILGAKDNFNEGNMSTNCQAMVQGKNRLERGQIYFQYMNQFFPQNKHSFATVPNVGHSSKGMFNSEVGRCLLFDYACLKSN